MLPQHLWQMKRFGLEILSSLSGLYCQHICVGTTAWDFQGAWPENTCVTQDDVISALICDHTKKLTYYKLPRRVCSGWAKKSFVGVFFPCWRINGEQNWNILDFSEVSEFIKLSNVYFAYVVSYLFGLNPILYLMLLNGIFHQYCCVFFLSYTLWV